MAWYSGKQDSKGHQVRISPYILMPHYVNFQHGTRNIVHFICHLACCWKKALIEFQIVFPTDKHTSCCIISYLLPTFWHHCIIENEWSRQDKGKIQGKGETRAGNSVQEGTWHSKKRVDLGVRGLTETLSSANSQLWRSVFGVTYHAVYKKWFESL